MRRIQRRLQKYILACVDMVLVACAYILTFLFLEIPFDMFYSSGMIYVAMITYLMVFIGLSVYNNLVRFSSIREYAVCYFACLVSSLIVGLEGNLLEFMASNRQHLLAGIFAGILCVGFRVCIRIVRKLQIARKAYHMDRKRLLIIGAGFSANMVVKEMLNDESAQYNVIGMIDDDLAKFGCNISGVRVLGTREEIEKICKEKKVDVILFAIPSADGRTRKAILEICKKTKCKVLVLPSVSELIEGRRFVDHIRDLDVSDLLCRGSVVLNNDAIGGLLNNQVVMVTGGGGSIGSELCRQIAKYKPSKLLILDIYENNAYDIENELRDIYPNLDLRVLIASVRDRARLEEIFAFYKPAVVFHAAAHKHVPLMENNPKEAIKNNVFGTLNVAECADRFGVLKFVLISTDKAVNPTNIMGATKRICEMIIQDLNCRSKTEYAAVRFGNVLGSNGSVIPLFKKQLAAGGPLTVTDKEITRFFMTIPEAAQLVLQAGSYAEGGEIFVLDMGSPVKIYDLAENLIRLSGYEPGKDIEIKVTGLRPGEKLYEELLMEEEGLKETGNKKIFITKPVDIDQESIRTGLQNLSQTIHEFGERETKEAVAKMVETYTIDLRYCGNLEEQDVERNSVV